SEVEVALVVCHPDGGWLGRCGALVGGELNEVPDGFELLPDRVVQDAVNPRRVGREPRCELVIRPNLENRGVHLGSRSACDGGESEDNKKERRGRRCYCHTRLVRVEFYSVCA